jgi:hypothetical protein
MASPLPTRKQSVNLTAPVRVSRIRRDPPPPAKKVSARERDERDVRSGMIGVLAFALAIAVILFALGSVAGWSPGQYTIHL